MYTEIKCNTKQGVTYCYMQVTPYCGKLSEPSKFEELVNEVVLEDENNRQKGHIMMRLVSQSY